MNQIVAPLLSVSFSLCSEDVVHPPRAFGIAASVSGSSVSPGTRLATIIKYGLCRNCLSHVSKAIFNHTPRDVAHLMGSAFSFTSTSATGGGSTGLRAGKHVSAHLEGGIPSTLSLLTFLLAILCEQCIFRLLTDPQIIVLPAKDTVSSGAKIPLSPSQEETHLFTW